MNHNDVVPIYAELLSISDYCEQAESVAEVHGIFCGLLARDTYIPAKLWVDVLELEGEPGDTGFQMVRQQLEDLLRHSSHMLNHIEVEFNPILPDDEESLKTRINEMAAWTQGYLYGFSSYKEPDDFADEFGQIETYEIDDDGESVAIPTGIELITKPLIADDDEEEAEELPETVAEILQDFAELSKAGHTEDVFDESDEASYMEVLEYLRVSVQLVFEEMAGKKLAGRQEAIPVDSDFMTDFNNSGDHDDETLH